MATGWATARSTGPGGSPVALLAWATRRGSRCPDCAVLARWGRQLPTRHGRRWATARGSSGATSRRSDLGEHGERGRDARPATAAAHQLSAILGDDGTARWATASRLSDQEASWPIGHGDGGTRDWPTLYGRTVPPQDRLRTRERLHGISPTQGGRRYCRGGGPAGRDTSWVQKLADWRCRGGEVRRWARGLGGCGASRQGPGPSGRRLPWQEQRAGRSTWWGRRLGLTSRPFALAEGDTVGRRLRCSTGRPVGQLAMAPGET